LLQFKSRKQRGQAPFLTCSIVNGFASKLDHAGLVSLILSRKEAQKAQNRQNYLRFLCFFVAKEIFEASYSKHGTGQEGGMPPLLEK